MQIEFKALSIMEEFFCRIVLLPENSNIDLLPKDFALNEEEKIKLARKLDNKKKIISFERNNYLMFFVYLEDKQINIQMEKARLSGYEIRNFCSSEKINIVQFSNFGIPTDSANAFAEGFILSNYSFDKYFSDSDKKTFLPSDLIFDNKNFHKNDILEIFNLANSVHISRDLINEPQNKLTARELAFAAQSCGKKFGFEVETLDKKRIESLGMGGLLAVNKGSLEPPTFSILSYTNKKAKNQRPIVIVGKGVTYDTGGLSLKPTANSMDEMKSDMSGAAAVIGLFSAIAQNKLNINVIGLIPATDNRPDGMAYAPGDVIRMHNSKTVEVLNTDAEGRMILADALSYGDLYEPQLILTIATLTGAASNAVGHFATVIMGNADNHFFDLLNDSGLITSEKCVEFPFWEEYGDLIKSDIADIKNIGGKFAGAITAGKFLEHFTKFPFIHLDIAGPAFVKEGFNYRGKGGTGNGVRLLYHFLKSLTKSF